MSKLERYLEFNWPKINDDIDAVDDQAIAVMRHLDQELGGKDHVIADLIKTIQSLMQDGRDVVSEIVSPEFSVKQAKLIGAIELARISLRDAGVEDDETAMSGIIEAGERKQ